MKTVLFLLDGLGDENYREIGNKTPLEYAKTPTFDKMAFKGSVGMLNPLGLGKEIPIENASQMLISTLGYDHRKIDISRGVLEAMGAGIKVKEGDLCARVNFSTIDSDSRIVNLRAKNINGPQLEEDINSIKMRADFVFKHTSKHRGVVVFKGNHSDKITKVDPHIVGEKVPYARGLTKEGWHSADIINEFLNKTHNLLLQHPMNLGRKQPVNFLLLRGIGSHIPYVQKFTDRYFKKAVGLAGMPVDLGVMKFLGMDIVQIPEGIEHELTSKQIKEVLVKNYERAVKKYDFISMHFKNTDTPGHDGALREKIRQIEQTDRFIGELDHFRDKRVIVTSDHRTSCKQKAHIPGPFPTLISPTYQTEKKFGEGWATDFSIPSHRLMPIVKALG